MNKIKAGFLLILLSIPTFSLNAEESITIATGDPSGLYYSLGKGLEKILENEVSGLDVQVITTSGSIENAEKIGNGSADIAFIQNDIAFNYLEGRYPFKEKSPNIAGIASLYTEMIQIISLKEYFLESLEDLENEPVAIGESGSGSEYNSLTILRASGIKDDDVIQKNISISDLSQALQDGEVTAAFITAGLQLPLINNIAEDLNFIPVGKETIVKLTKEHSYFVATSIPAYTYPGQNEPIQTVGIKALLVARKDLDTETVRTICSLLYRFRKNLKAISPVASRIRISSASHGMTIPLHKGAEEYFKSKFIFRIIVILALLTFIIILIIIFKKYLRKLYLSSIRLLRHNIHCRIGLVVFMLFAVGTLGSFYFEHKVNDYFGTIFKSLWATILYLLSGFEIEPITTGGKFSAFLLLIGGIGILGTVVGNIASIFMKEGVEKMPRNLKEHIAICNWNKRGDTIVKELHHPNAEPNTEIIILMNSDVNERELRERSKRYANVFFIKGKPTSYETLESSRIHLAKSVIILSDSNDDEPDPKTILTCIAIRKLAQNKAKPHIIAELMDTNNRQIALDAGANEIVSAGFYRTGIMLQSALYHNLSDIFHELLIYKENTSSVFILEKDKIPQLIYGMTFQEASYLFNKNRNDKNPVILIGVRRVCEDGESHIILNPIKDGVNHHGEFDKFREGDALVVIAQGYPNLSYLKA